MTIVNLHVAKPSVLSIALLNTIAHTDVFSSSMRDCAFSHVSCSAWTRDVKSSPIHNPFDSCEWFSCYDCSDHMVCLSYQDLVRASYAHTVCVLLEDVHMRHMVHVCYKGALQRGCAIAASDQSKDSGVTRAVTAAMTPLVAAPESSCRSTQSGFTPKLSSNLDVAAASGLSSVKTAGSKRAELRQASSRS